MSTAFTPPPLSAHESAAPPTSGDFVPPSLDSHEGVSSDHGIGEHLSALYEGLKTAPIAHPIELLKSTLGMVAHPIDTLKGDADSRKQLYEDAAKAFKNGDYGPGMIKGLLSFLPLVGPQLGPYYQEMKDAQAKGDTIGEAKAAGKLLGIAGSAAALKAPEIISGIPNAAETAVTAVKGAAEGAKEGLTGMTTVRVHGLPIKVPDVVAGATAGAGVARMTGVIPHEVGAAIGAASPVAYRAYQGLREALADLSDKRAAATQAAQAITDKIKSTLPEEPAPGPIPPDRQLPPPSQIQTPPPANAVTDYQPPAVAAEDSGPLPTDPVSGRPLPMGPEPSLKVAQNAEPQMPIAPNEMLSRDDLSKSFNKKPYGEATKEQKAVVDSWYDTIHGTAPTVPAESTAPPELTGELEYHAPEPSATPEPSLAAAPVAAAPEPPEPPAAPPAEPEAPADTVKPPASRVVNVPGDPSKQFAPSKLMTEEGLAQYAKDNGITEQEASASLGADGYQVIGRSQLNRALHGVASELGMDHATLSDVAKIKHRIKSMTQLSQEDMLGLYQDLLDKRSISEPLAKKSDLAAGGSK